MHWQTGDAGAVQGPAHVWPPPEDFCLLPPVSCGAGAVETRPAPSGAEANGNGAGAAGQQQQYVPVLSQVEELEILMPAQVCGRMIACWRTKGRCRIRSCVRCRF